MVLASAARVFALPPGVSVTVAGKIPIECLSSHSLRDQGEVPGRGELCSSRATAPVPLTSHQELQLLLKSACLIKKSPTLVTRSMEAPRKRLREREKAEILMRLRSFAERSKWKKARLSRELGVSISTVDRWLDGQDNILLASMFAIRRFLEQRE
jgi:hypothetical protein